MNELTASEIARLTRGILEKIGFIFVEQTGADPDEETLYHAKISYCGPDESAELWVSASEELLTELAANMLGVEPDEVQIDVEGLQALNEFANIICGEVIGALGGEQTIFSQGIPENVGAVAPAGDGEERTNSNMASEEGEPLRVIVSRNVF